MARIQKIESDSSFQLSQVLEGTFLTYKTQQNGRIVHKAKLANGNVVELNGRPFKYKKITSSTRAVDQDFLICYQDLKITLPTVVPNSIIGISTGTNTVKVVIEASGPDKIQIGSDSLVGGIVLAQKMSTVLLVAQQGHWAMAAGYIQPVKLNQIQDLLQNFYTEDIEPVLQRITSNSTIKDIYEKFTNYYTKEQISNSYYTKDQIDHILSNSLSQYLQNYYTIGQIDKMLAELSNSFSISLSNYYTKLEVNGFVQALSNSINALRDSLTASYYASSTTSLALARLEGFIASKIDKPSSTVPNGYVLVKTLDGTSWGSIATEGTPFVSSDYYKKSEIDGILSDSYYTIFQINVISSGLNQSINDRLENPVNEGSVGNILIKTAAGTSWGGSVYTGDTFSSASYYTSDLIDGMITTLSDSLHTKLTAPVGGSQGDVLIKTSSGTSWGSIAGGGTQTQTWTSITIPSTGALVIDPASGALQKFTMTRNLIISAPTLTATSNELTLQVAHNATSNYVLSKGALQITVGQNLLFTWYYDGDVTRELPTIYLGK